MSAAAEPAPSGGGLGLVEVRRLWPDLLDAVKLKRRYTWILLSQNAQVAAVDEKTLTIALLNAGARNAFVSSGSDEILRQAAIDVIGQDWRVEAIVDPSAQPGTDPHGATRVVRPAVQPDSDPGRGPGASADAHAHDLAQEGSARDPSAQQRPAQQGSAQEGQGAAPSAAPAPSQPAVDPGRIADARDAIQRTREAGATQRGAPEVSDDDAHPDDPDADDNGLGGTQLLERELGARVIEEIKHE